MTKRAIDSPLHTGSMNLVYESIARGKDLVVEIAADTGLDLDVVRNSIIRLRDAGRVKRERSKERRPLTRYVPVRDQCLLSECWRGAT